MNRMAIVTGGYVPAATYSRQLVATNGYWDGLIGVAGGIVLRWFVLKVATLYYYR